MAEAAAVLPSQTLSASVWSDLGPLKTVSVPVVKYLVAQVADQLASRSYTKTALSTEAISKDLENEGVEWSNKKIVRVCDALQTLIIAHQSSFKINPDTAKTIINDEITSRSSITKPALIEGLADALNSKSNLLFLNQCR